MKKFLKLFLLFAVFFLIGKVYAASGDAPDRSMKVNYSVIVKNANGAKYYTGTNGSFKSKGTLKVNTKLKITTEYYKDVYDNTKIYLEYKDSKNKKYYVLAKDVSLSGNVKDIKHSTTNSNKDMLILGDAVKLYQYPTIMSKVKGRIKENTKFQKKNIKCESIWCYGNDGTNKGWVSTLEGKESILYYYNQNGASYVHWSDYSNIKNVKEVYYEGNSNNETLPEGTIFKTWFLKDFDPNYQAYVVYNGYLLEVSNYAINTNIECVLNSNTDLEDSNGNIIETISKGTTVKSTFVIENDNSDLMRNELEYNGKTGWVRLDCDDRFTDTPKNSDKAIGFAFTSNFDTSNVMAPKYTEPVVDDTPTTTPTEKPDEDVVNPTEPDNNQNEVINPSEEKQETTETKTESSSNDNLILYIILGALVVVIIILLVVLSKRKQNNY